MSYKKPSPSTDTVTWLIGSPAAIRVSSSLLTSPASVYWSGYDRCFLRRCQPRCSGWRWTQPFRHRRWRTVLRFSSIRFTTLFSLSLMINRRFVIGDRDNREHLQSAQESRFEMFLQLRTEHFGKASAGSGFVSSSAQTFMIVSVPRLEVRMIRVFLKSIFRPSPSSSIPLSKT